MKEFRKFLFGFLGLYVLAALSLAHAENPGPGDSPQSWHSGQRIQEIYNQLNLTFDQTKQLEANKQQQRSRMAKAHQEMKISKEALKEELMKPQLDMARITELHKKIKALLSQMEDDRLSSILTVRTILTPEQFTKFVNLMHKHKQEHKE